MTQHKPKPHWRDTEFPFIPLQDHVIVRLETSKDIERASGITLLSPLETYKRGFVMAVGPGRTEMGKRMKPDVEVGDRVIVGNMPCTQLEVTTEGGVMTLHLMRESNCLAIINFGEEDEEPGYSEEGSELNVVVPASTVEA